MSDSNTGPTTRFLVFCGLDVGKDGHHAVALDSSGRRLLDRTVTNDEQALRVLLGELQARGPALVVVDQVAAIGALPVAVARAMHISIGYLPGLAMRRLADLHPGEGKTDARDAFIIADAARTLPHTLRRVDGDELLAELTVLAGYDSDLAAEVTRLTNRLHDALTHVHPALERLLGRHFDRPGVLDLLAAAPTPEQLQRLGRRGIVAALRPRSPRLAAGQLPDQILDTLSKQTVTVPGTGAFGRVIAGVARQLRQVRDERDGIAEQLKNRLAAHPLAQVLTSMPGVGVRTAINILVHVGDGSAFPSAAHLAAYAGLAPVTRRSGSSVRGETKSRRGNRALRDTLYLSAFASLRDPASRAYYDRKRAEGKRHAAALLCLARRRTDVLYAMINKKTPYRSQPGPSSSDQVAAA